MATTCTSGINDRFFGGLPIVVRTPLMEFPSSSTTSVIGTVIGGFPGQSVWYEGTQRRDNRRILRRAILHHRNTQVSREIAKVQVCVQLMAASHSSALAPSMLHREEMDQPRLTNTKISTALRRQFSMSIGARAIISCWYAAQCFISLGCGVDRIGLRDDNLINMRLYMAAE